MLLNICVCIIVFLVGFNLKNYFSGFSSKEKKLFTQLFFFHFLIAIVFHFYLVANGGDAFKYWNLPRENSFDHIIGLVVNRKASSFMYLINYFPSAVLDLSLFTGNMIYALFGYLGFIYLYKTIRELTPNMETLTSIKIFGVPVFPWMLFMPNFHFWSSGVGKDAILFTSIILFIYAIQHLKKRWVLMLVGLVLALVIRPHIILFLLISFSIGYILDGGLKVYQKIFIVIFLMVGLVSIFDYVIQFIQLESLEISSIEEYTSSRVSNLGGAGSGSSIDISNYPFPLKIFTFLYRPLFFDVNGVLAILASAENLILVVFTILIFRNKPFASLKKSSYLIKGILLYFLIGTTAFSLILGNLGIMLRQKNMFIPMLLVLGLWMIYHNMNSKIATKHEGTPDC